MQENTQRSTKYQKRENMLILIDTAITKRVPESEDDKLDSESNVESPDVLFKKNQNLSLNSCVFNFLLWFLRLVNTNKS